MPCTNGATPKPGAPTGFWINYSGLVTQIPNAPSNLLTLLDGLPLAGDYIRTADLCGAPQPAVPAMDWTTLRLDNLVAYLRGLSLNQAYVNYCQCNAPGGTDASKCVGKSPGWYGVFNYVGLPNGPAVDRITGSNAATDTITFITNPSDPAGCRRVLVNGVYFGQKPCPPPGQQLTECRAIYCAGGTVVDQPTSPTISGVPAGSLGPVQPTLSGDLGGGAPLPPNGFAEGGGGVPPTSPDPSCCDPLEWVFAGTPNQGTVYTVPTRKICRALVTVQGWEQREAKFGNADFPDQLFRVGQVSFGYGSGFAEPQFIRLQTQTFNSSCCGADTFAIEPDRAGVSFTVRLGLLPEQQQSAP